MEAFSQTSVHVLSQLAIDPKCSVDLKELAEPLRGQPTNFTSHVLNAFRRLQDLDPRLDDATIGTEVHLIKNILPYLVACVAGGVLRAQERGSTNDEVVIYGDRWREILGHVNEKQFRCEEIFREPRCLNYRDGHGGGHQHALAGGRLRAGEFKSEFSDNIDTLHKSFVHSLMNSNILRKGNSPNWARELLKQASVCGVREIVNNRTCLACLSRIPIHIMPCGHFVCDICASILNSRLQFDETLLELKRCPFGYLWSSGRAIQIRRKPAEAGVRILSLGGGGVRGIVEFVVLKAILDRVGHNLPIQELFDVIVGTSTGGIIALGIFKKKWTMPEAMREFEDL